MTTSKTRGFMLVLVLFPMVVAAVPEQVQQVKPVIMVKRIESGLMGVSYGICGIALWSLAPTLYCNKYYVDSGYNIWPRDFWHSVTNKHIIASALLGFPAGHKLVSESIKKFKKAFFGR